PNLGHYLDLVALGTVADLVPLDHINRCLVSQGLIRINQGLCCPGIPTLLELARGQQEFYQAQDLGFAVAPRLNAAGRLDDMTLGIECLLSETKAGALPLAEELNAWNLERRAIQDTMQQQANAIVNKYKTKDLAKQAGLCLYSDAWHEGVVGLVASRIKDQVYRPTIVFAPADEPHMIKGSARSIKGIHIRDVLDLVASQKPHLLQKFGGHAMAAGLSIAKNHLEEFTETFNQTVRDWSDPAVFENILWSDGALIPADMTLDNALLLEELGPWGQLFSEPCFDGQFEVYDWQILKDKHIKFQLEGNAGGILEAIAFNVDETLLETAFSRIEILYRMNVNRFRGSRRVQLLIDYLKPL
ncbi:MAG: single-stranded-DNA-specific exonuclease RecJ, partial [Gammaproteobacteria bacterium]|nr:single-stranded-DNA-specific exonuclease RecJ [Gammaproteobacteria bacterium]